MQDLFRRGIASKIYLPITVDKFKRPGDFPMTVAFDTGNNGQYTTDGRFYFNSPPILSFTEYTLSGFSQETC